MAKTGDVLPTLLRGVSQQPPEVRLDGQHTEQINMVSDPIHGLCRRAGSVAVGSSLLGGASAGAEFADWVCKDVQIEGEEYALLTRKAASPSGLPPVLLYRKRDGVRITVSASSGALSQLVNGVAAQTVAGRFLVLAGVGQVSTATQASPPTLGYDYLRYDSDANRNRAVVWVKAGATGRTYRIRVTLTNGTVLSSDFAVRSPYYPTALDVSSIVYSDPAYVKKVNDATNAYNQAVVNWQAAAANEAQPMTIATNLRNGLTPYVALDVGVQDEVFILIRAVPGYSLGKVEAWDSGSGEDMQVVHLTVESEDQLAPHGFPGRTVKVQPKNGDSPWYAAAISTNYSGYPVYGTPVTWQEYTSDYRDLTGALVFGAVVGSTLYLGESTTELASLSGVTVPRFTAGRVVGDDDTSPLPFFAGRPITYLGMFQDRMVIGCGPVLNFSEAGSYFNFCRTTVLTYPDSDPVEAYAAGSGGDNIRHGLIFDKSLLLFGDRRQYMVPGSVPLTPKTVQVAESSTFEDTTDAAPTANGSLVFYGQTVEGASQLFQIATGAYVDSSVSQEVTQQLGTYIQGKWVTLAACTAPDFVVARTAGMPYGLYVYRYLDSGQQRALDSWSRWEYSPLLGQIMGATFYKGELLLFHARQEGGSTYLCVDKQSMLGKPTGRPHLDSARTVASGALGMPTSYAQFSAAYQNVGSTGPSFIGVSSIAATTGLLADFPAWGAAYLWAGAPMASSVTLTNPFRKGYNGKVSLQGRTTISSIRPTVEATGGMLAAMTAHEQASTQLDFNGRMLNTPADLVGTHPLYSGTLSIPIGRETREYTLTLHAKTWLPCTITAIEWTGQYFNL
jgi:hypothetical protein